MKNLIAIAALLMITVRSLAAQEFDPREISLKIKNAADPKSAFYNAKSYLIKQKIEVIGGERGEFEVEIKFKMPDKLKTSYFFKNKLMNAILMKGDKAWRISGIDGKVEEISGLELERLKLFHDVASPKALLYDIFDEMKIDEVKINEEDLYRIFCRPKNENLPHITFFVGQGDYLQRRMQTSNEKGEPFSAEILKYTLIENIFVPAETRVLSGGIEQRITLEKFSINIDIPDEEFEVNQKR